MSENLLFFQELILSLESLWYGFLLHQLWLRLSYIILSNFIGLTG